ncbi:MAG: PaaX family transcriptional regulator C-terminal domain-containing protein [Acidimicrobiales bacterium]
MADLSARSIVASTLLGTIPPRLPGRLLVAFAEEFGVNPGTTRVALSRMVDRGELHRETDGHYVLAGPLLERQVRQEAGLAPRVRPWSGAWEVHVVLGGARDAGERAGLRQAAAHLGLRERREGVWLRPDNLDPERLPSAREVVATQTERYLATPAGDPAALVVELFDLEPWATEARKHIRRMSAMSDRLDAGSPGSLADGFAVAAHSLRHLVADPLLPVELHPPEWPATALRRSYDEYDRTYRRHLSAFFRSRSRLAG